MAGHAVTAGFPCKESFLQATVAELTLEETGRRRAGPLRDRGLTRSEAAGTGAVAFVLLMLAEAALSVGLSGRTVTEHLALYGEPAHLLGLAGQMAFATFPLMRR
jgi:hypothetical protein